MDILELLGGQSPRQRSPAPQGLGLCPQPELQEEPSLGTGPHGSFKGPFSLLVARKGLRPQAGEICWPLAREACVTAARWLSRIFLWAPAWLGPTHPSLLPTTALFLASFLEAEVWWGHRTGLPPRSSLLSPGQAPVPAWGVPSGAPSHHTATAASPASRPTVRIIAQGPPPRPKEMCSPTDSQLHSSQAPRVSPLTQSQPSLLPPGDAALGHPWPGPPFCPRHGSP